MIHKILVVDDHPVFRTGLVALLQNRKSFQVIAEAGDIADAMKALESRKPDIALVDISLGAGSGLELVRMMKEAHSGVPVLIVTMHDEVVYAERALKAGARGLVMKQEAPETILTAIETVLSGRIYLSDTMNDRMIQSMFPLYGSGSVNLTDRLTERELEVLEYFGQGYGAGETARVLNLSVKTINTYQERLKEKLDQRSSSDLRRFAVTWFRSIGR